MKFQVMANCGVLVGLAAGLCGTGSADAQTKSVVLAPHHDPWAKAVPRLWDIENRAYSSFLSTNPASFDYADAHVELTYDTNPSVRHFVGQIKATGLKRPTKTSAMRRAGGAPRTARLPTSTTTTIGTTTGALCWLTAGVRTPTAICIWPGS
jgi:hypothetical protein